MLGNFKANYKLENLSSGLNEFPSSGGTSIHQIYCVSNGSFEVTAEGGGVATISLTSNQTFDVVTRKIDVNSGSFIGFRVKGN